MFVIIKVSFHSFYGGLVFSSVLYNKNQQEISLCFRSIEIIHRLMQYCDSFALRHVVNKMCIYYIKSLTEKQL